MWTNNIIQAWLPFILRKNKLFCDAKKSLIHEDRYLQRYMQVHFATCTLFNVTKFDTGVVMHTTF